MSAAILADDLRALGSIQAECSRPAAAFVRWRLRSWAAAIERGDRAAVRMAFAVCSATVEVFEDAPSYPLERAVYPAARAILRTAYAATRAA